jgi:branched-chain amino acid transport system permease protein
VNLRNPVLTFISLAIIGFALDIGSSAFIQISVLFILVNTIVAMSLNLVNGITGQFSLGHAGFMAVGAYVSSYLSLHLPIFNSSYALLGFVFTVTAGGLLAAFFGYLVGQPSLRLKGDYLAIVTLGFGEIIRVAVLNMDFLGGARGMSGVPTMPEILGLSRFFVQYLFCTFWCVLCFYVLWRLTYSSEGRAFLSVREDEVAAESLGVNTTKMKVRAFIISSFFAGVAGALSAHYIRYISPSTFSFLKSIDAVIMVVLGGMGSMTGAIIAAVFITLLPELLRDLQKITGVDLRMVIYSLALILVMILRPQGLLGRLEISDVIKKWRRRASS